MMNTPKKFSREDKKASLMRGMQIGLIPNTSPNYADEHVASELASGLENMQPQLKTVTLAQLKPFDNNPRKTQNPKFAEIKESIRMRGLDFPPNITQRPGDDFYMIADGGNTRLQALRELYEETKDPKYWSISCLFKTWKGSEGDQLQGELSCLIGHLAENDLRGDLSFIERALGINQAKLFYEKQENIFLSHRKLAEKLKNDGYSISHSLISKMEQCLAQLYPAIPQVLFGGLGKHQIEKLLTLRGNAFSCWKKYHPNAEEQFSDLWLETLKPFDEVPEEFTITIVQDELIGNLVKALGDEEVTYQDLHFDINIDENRRRSTESEPIIHVKNPVTAVEISDSISSSDSNEVHYSQEPVTLKKTIESIPSSPVSKSEGAGEYKIESKQDIPSTHFAETDKTGTATNGDYENILAQFGMTPGLSLSEQRKQRAEENGLSFANTGCQPVDDIWKIFPVFDTANKLRLEAFNLVNDLAKLSGLPKSVIKNIGAQQSATNFSFTIEPLPRELENNALTLCVYELLAMLACDNHADMLAWSVPEVLLVGTDTTEAEISDLLMVKIFRLIRVIRRFRAHLRQPIEQD
ncbi:ParB family protein [Pasteurella testudinis]|uniref:ParB family protein n=1 Tax=Pasteurella testudinis TaxID=761 RepID=UPI004057E075